MKRAILFTLLTTIFSTVSAVPISSHETEPSYDLIDKFLCRYECIVNGGSSDEVDHCFMECEGGKTKNGGEANAHTSEVHISESVTGTSSDSDIYQCQLNCLSEGHIFEGRLDDKTVLCLWGCEGGKSKNRSEGSATNSEVRMSKIESPAQTTTFGCISDCLAQPHFIGTVSDDDIGRCYDRCGLVETTGESKRESNLRGSEGERGHLRAVHL
eukprot:scaffold12576_cov35-Cyclotella_meneghiniana.AAC.2